MFAEEAKLRKKDMVVGGPDRLRSGDEGRSVMPRPLEGFHDMEVHETATVRLFRDNGVENN